jgi:hypothetical protein
MLKISLTKRPAKIGKSVNTRTEMHGTDEVPGLDIPVAGMLVNAEELGLVCDDPETHERWYRKDKELGVIPAFPGVEVIHIDHKFENASVNMTGPSIEKAAFGNAKIKSIRFARQIGGLTMMSFTLQVNPENGIDVPKLLNAKISIGIKSAELEVESEDEPELPLEHSQEEIDAAEAEEEEATESAIGRKIRHSEVKRKRGRPRKDGT